MVQYIYRWGQLNYSNDIADEWRLIQCIPYIFITTYIHILQHNTGSLFWYLSFVTSRRYSITCMGGRL